ncbi:MAG TPA: hypothetical protein VM599_03255 [Thermoanaerobaculia bacterium]|nr:hypothetical protein [Thermoanaerobaculia bacterium]
MLKTFQAVYSGIKAFTFSAAQTRSTSRGFPSAYELPPTERDSHSEMSPFKRIMCINLYS